MITDPLLNPQSEETLARLMRMVRRANGFVLGFVKCNSPVQQRRQSQELKSRLGDLPTLEISLDSPILSLLEHLDARIDPNAPPALVNVYGLEKSVYSDRDYSPMLGRLNNDRDLIRRACPTALLIWLPDYALDKLVLSAPDFWAWRSGVYEFPTDISDWRSASSIRLDTEPYQLASMTLAEKQQEIVRLEELIRTARSLPNAGSEEGQIMAGLLLKVAGLYDDVGELTREQSCLQESISLYRESNNIRGVSTASHDLAHLMWFQGQIEEALKLLREELAVYEKLGDRWSRAVTLGDIARILTDKGQIDEALKLHREELAIYEKLGRTRSRAVALGYIARILTDKSQIDEALKLHQEQLGIFEQLEDRSGIANALWSIAMIQLERANFAEAAECLQRSYAILTDIERLDGISIVGATWGQVLATMGRREEGLAVLNRSRDGFVQLGQLDNARRVEEMIAQISGQGNGD